MDTEARRDPPPIPLWAQIQPRIAPGVGLLLVVLLITWLAINLEKTPALFYTAFTIGLENGALYGLVALGYTLVYGILGSLAVAMAACGLINVTIERVAYKPLRNAPRLAPLITAIGMSFIVQDS